MPDNKAKGTNDSIPEKMMTGGFSAKGTPIINPRALELNAIKMKISAK